MFDTLRGYGFTGAQADRRTGLAPSSKYERDYPGHRRVDNPTPHPQRRSDIACTGVERWQMAEQINASPQHTINQIYFDLGNAGQAIGRLATYRRIARSGMCPDRYTPQPAASSARRPEARPLQLIATRPY